MTFKRYKKYKESGIGWIREIPEDWNIYRAKYIFKEVNEKSQDGLETLLSVSEYYGVLPRKNVIDDGDYISRANSLIGYKKCKSDDLVMNIMLAWKKGYGITDYDGIVSPAYAVFRCLNKSFYPKYFHYLLRIKLYTNEFKRNSTGIIASRLRLYPEEFLRINILLPTYLEQKSIATFLDNKTQQIDTLIEKKQQQIELLKEQRTAVINQAVIKGLAPNVKMKDSGIKWIGEIPEHWEVKKLKFFSNIVLGKMLTPQDKGNYIKKPYLRAKNILWEKVDDTDIKEMWFSPQELSQYKLKENNLLVSEGGEVGRTAIWKNELLECYIQNSVHKVSINRQYDYKYFLYHFLIYGKRNYFDSIVNRVSIAHLTKEKLENVDFLVPPENEQKDISIFLDNQTSQIDSLITKIENQISLLQEYRTTLISEVVTGKIDVRDYNKESRKA